MASFLVIAETKFSLGTIIPELPRCSCLGHRSLLPLAFFFRFPERPAYLRKNTLSDNGSGSLMTNGFCWAPTVSKA